MSLNPHEQQQSKNRDSHLNHIVVLHHGLWGNAEHMKKIQENLELNDNSSQLFFLNISVNENEFTFDGIDLLGNRTIEQLQQCLAERNFSKISFVGYSLGKRNSTISNRNP